LLIDGYYLTVVGTFCLIKRFLPPTLKRTLLKKKEKIIDQQAFTTLQHEYIHTNSTTSISIEEPFTIQILDKVHCIESIIKRREQRLIGSMYTLLSSYLGQGSIGDWSAIYLYTELNISFIH